MKKGFLVISLLVVGVLFTSCNGDKGGETEIKIEYENSGKDLYNFKAFNLQPYGIDALIYLPDATANIGASSKPVVQHEMDDYKWYISIGKHFHIKIEDWGDDNAFQEKLNQLKNQDIYAITFLEKKDNFAYYKADLKVGGQAGHENVGVEHKSYHVIAQQTINGINYLFKTTREGCSKRIAKYMAKSVQNVEPIVDKKLSS